MQENLPTCTPLHYKAFRLLVVDADAGVCAALVQALDAAGYAVQSSTSGQQAIQLLERECFDALVIDPALPDVAGQCILEQMRRCSPDIVIIVLAREVGLESALEAIRYGASSYIRKPARSAEMVGELMRTLGEYMPRICHNASLRLMREVMVHWYTAKALSVASDDADLVCCGDQAVYIRLDRERQTVRLQQGGIVRESELTREEMGLLQALMAQPGCVLSHDDLAAIVCPAAPCGHRARNLVRHYVYHLRRKIETDPAHPRIIHTVRGEGYLLDAVPAAQPLAVL
ncbi:MAG: response regulator transcription factor [Anaerolineae bacterium]